MPRSGKSTEKELATAALHVLAKKSSGIASYQELILEIPKHHSLTAIDHWPSSTRPGEEMWEQRVRNITSHHSSPGNFIYRGYLASVPDGLRITQLGQNYLQKMSSLI